MGFMRAAAVVSAVFDRREDMEAAIKDLHATGIHDHEMRTLELVKGSYLLEDEMTPERSWRGRMIVAGAMLAGVVVGIIVVAVALGADASFGPYTVGAAAGALFGAVAGGGAVTVYVLPMDDDEDVYLDVREGDHEFLAEVEVHEGHTLREVRGILLDHDARAFLAPAFPPTTAV